MTYQQLAQKIAALTDDQQQCDVTVYCEGDDEYMACGSLHIANATQDQLDEGHPVLHFLIS